MRKGIIYLTDNLLDDKIALVCQKALADIVANGNYELVSSSRVPMEGFGKNVVTDMDRGYECYFRQILKGLQALSTDLVFIAENDVIYPPEHFEFDPPDSGIWYDVNWWKVFSDGFAISWEADQVSGICAPKRRLLDWYQMKVEQFDANSFDRKFEPLSGEGSKQWKAPRPHIDIRHGNNLTYSKRGLHHFRKKDTAVNLRESTIDQIEGWNLATQDIYG